MDDHDQMVKTLIESADSIEEVDRLIDKYARCTNVAQKLAYLYDMFDIVIVGGHNSTDDESLKQQVDYEAVVTTIINKKWR